MIKEERENYRDPNYDDVADDAAAAYAEVMERTARETVAPAGNGPADDKDIEEILEPAGVEGKGGGKGAASRTPAKEETRDDGRDERGRFASTAPAQKSGRGKADTADKAAGGERGQEQKPADKAAGEGDPAAQSVAGGPPPSFSVATKAAWDKLPEHVRADILKRETEMGQGLAALRDYKDLKPWSDMAQKHGTTIGKALERYTGLENLLRRDLAAGMRVIAQNFGMSQEKAAEFFANMAASLSGKAPAAGTASNGMKPDDPLMQVLQPVLGPVMQEISQLRQSVAAREAAEKSARSQSLGEAIEKFAADPKNRYFGDVEESVTRLFETGYVPLTGNHLADLQKAYEIAISTHPEIQKALIEQRLEEAKAAERKKEQEAAEKAKKASRSITGSRAPGTVIKDREDAPLSHDDDIEADVRRAYRLHAQV